MLRLALLSLLVVGSGAFVTTPALSAVRTQRATALNLIMTEEEISAILSKANGCVESECAVSDVDDLIAELRDQQKVLSARLENIMNAVAHLQAANAAGDKRKTDDVRSIVKDMLRVFTTGDGKFAMGFSGDIGDGPTTAYDALPPKPWKAAP
ncbi:hypothetical protein ACHAXA_004590 [Cyclostephanos tholiformis]|uniref:Uncharacterized protein n=1 Tax=Cyclostephanos tholiformis TaxID=382380 RepID=A0ABD3SP38_9STRA